MERGRVLDVKLRSHQVRATRMRTAALGFGVLFGTVFGLYLLWRAGDWALNRLILQNNTFAIRQLDVQTDGVISADQLRRWARVRPGQNLFDLDLAKVKRDLELVPAIGSVSVERVLPQGLRIRVSEREPVAQVNVARRSARGGVEVAVFHLDPEGYVMQPLEPRQLATPPNPVNDPLPVLMGVNPAELQPGRRVESPQVLAALELIAEFDHSPMAGLVDLRCIDVSPLQALIVTTGQGSEVTFGLQDLGRQLRRWREIYDRGQRTNLAIASLDLAVTNNIPARWLEAGAVPAAAPRMPKTPRNKKNHV